MVNQTHEGLTMGIQRLSLQDLPPGEVLIQVAYAALNYKDALVSTARGKVAQTSPLVFLALKSRLILTLSEHACLPIKRDIARHSEGRRNLAK
jgi:hypothetical protein